MIPTDATEDGRAPGPNDISMNSRSDKILPPSPPAPASEARLSPSSLSNSAPVCPSDSSLPQARTTVPLKRTFLASQAASTVSTLSPDSSDCELSDSDQNRRSKRRRQTGPKAGSSWEFQKSLKSRAQDPGFKVHDKKLNTFRGKIRDIDLRAEFYDDDHLAVRCSACGSISKMRALYDVRRFREHRQSRRCQARQSTGLKSVSLVSMGFGKLQRDSSYQSLPCMVQGPCPGLTTSSNAKIGVYLSRTPMLTGGAQSRIKIARRLFDLGSKHYWTELSESQKAAVIRREEVEAAWRNCRAVDAVFSTQCEDTVYTAVGKDPDACSRCKDLYELKTFQNAIGRDAPADDKMKYVPKAYRCPELGAIFIRYHGLRALMEQVSPLLLF